MSLLSEEQIYGALAAILIISLSFYNHLMISQIQYCPWWRIQGLKTESIVSLISGLHGLVGVFFMNASFFEIYNLFFKLYIYVLTIASVFLLVSFLL